MNSINRNSGEANLSDGARAPRETGATQGIGEDIPNYSPLPSARLTAWQKFKLIVRVAEIRLRFIAILIVVFLFVGYWDTITNYWDRETRSDGSVYNAVHNVLGKSTAHWLWPQAEATAVQSNSEYFCPMHPNVVRNTLDPDGSLPKCPICGMPLSLRKKGEVPKLPPGVLSRKQYSPEQIQAAGIRTAEVSYRPLEKTITTVGYVTFDESKRSRITVRVSGFLEKLYVDKPWTNVMLGQPLGEIYSPELYSAARELLVATRQGRTSDLAQGAREKLRLFGVSDSEIDEIVKSGKANHRLVLRAPSCGHLIRKAVVEGAHVEAGQTLFELADLSRVWIEAQVYEADIDYLGNGQSVEAQVEAFPGRVFAAKVSLVHPHMDPTTRTNAVRFELENPKHALRPGMFATVRIKTPLADIEPFRTLAAKSGDVLAVPEASVIDTGTKKIVYVEREPGLFEGAEVELGLQVAEFYPVIKGLNAGDRVAARGAFLVDAETRLNPAAAAAYVGASGGPHGPALSPAAPGASPDRPTEEKHSHPQGGGPLAMQQELSEEDRQKIASLAAEDREKAIAQGICPVSGEPLGSMGVPVKIVLKGQTAFLCCKGCVNQAKKTPDQVLKKIAEHTTANTNGRTVK